MQKTMTIICRAPLCNLCCNTEYISMYMHKDASWLKFNQLFIVLMLDRACVVYQLCYSSMQRVLGSAQCLINVHQWWLCSSGHQVCVVHGVFMPPPFEEWWRGIKCYPCPCVRPSVRPLSKFGVRSITFERLHRFDSYLACWYVISKRRSSSIWVTIH